LATIPHGEAETATKIYISHTQATKYYTASNVLCEGTEGRRM